MVTAERTRYRPTGGGVAYGLVAGLILAGAVYTQNNLLFWGFGLMLGGLAASAFLAWFTLGGLRL